MDYLFIDRSSIIIFFFVLFFNLQIVLLACMLAFAACAPAPGGWGGKQ